MVNDRNFKIVLYLFHNNKSFSYIFVWTETLTVMLIENYRKL